MRIPPELASTLVALGLVSSSCGDRGSGLAGPSLPALPAYVDEFDPSVRELLESSHAELEEEPGDPARWLQLGMAYEAHDEAGQAVPCYRGALELDPASPRARYRLALALQTDNELEGAIEALRGVVASGERYVPAYWRLGQLLLETGQLSEARQALERAIELDPTDPAGPLGLVQLQLRLGENQAVIEALEGSPWLEGPNGPWAMKQLGTAYQRLGREEEARVLLALSTDAHPMYRDPWQAELDPLRRGMASIVRQARALIPAGRGVEAVRILEAARERDPDHLSILRTLGAAYLAVGRTRAANEVLHRVAELDPANPELRVDAGWALVSDGDLDGALQMARSVIADAPENPKAHVLHARVLLELGRQVEAIDAFHEAMERGAREPELLIEIAKKELELGRLEDARQSFALAAQQNAGLLDAWIGQAIVALRAAEGDASELDNAETALARAEAFMAVRPGPPDPMAAEIRAELARRRSRDHAKAGSSE